MPLVIILSNAFAQALAMTIMGIDFIRPNRYIRLSCLFILFCIQALFIGFFPTSILVNMGMVLCCIIISFYINAHQKNYLKSINTAVTILLICTVAIVIFSSFTAFVFPALFEMDNPIHSLFMQISIIGFAFLVKRYKGSILISTNDKKLLQFYLIFKILLLFIWSLGAYLIYVLFINIYALVLFTVMILMIVGTFFVKHLLSLENEYKKTEYELAERYVEAKNVNKRYDEIIKYKHYMIALYKSAVSYIDADDMQGWREYFTKNITPIHDQLDKEVGNYHQIEYIKIDLIKARIVELINTVSQLPNVNLYLHINNVINHVAMKDIDLFAILNIYIDNAVEEVMKQEKGEITVNIRQAHNVFAFSIENTLVDKKSTPKPHNTHQGFKIVDEILNKYPHSFVNMSNKGGVFLQVLEVCND